jgi:Na+-transporting NADH:ubiquinone oxidoreductase subunit D
MSAALKKTVVDPLLDNNPIMVQLLGICSALAVTTQLKNALVMSAAVTVVVTCSCLIISLLRNIIPSKIRMIVEMVVISSLVIIADQFMKAFIFEVSLELSVFVGLIITNCIVMGRCEAYAISNPPWPAFLDGLGNALGYGLVLIAVGAVRELFAFGTLLGYHVMPQAYVDNAANGLIGLPVGAFIIIGLFIWMQRESSGKYETE